jgi:hypothetical protein
VHIQPVTINVTTTSSNGSYVDVIGFIVCQVTYLDSNSIRVRTVSQVYADAGDPALSRGERPRLTPW